MQPAARLCIRILFVASAIMVTRPAVADVMTLSSQNSSVQINPNSQAGIYDWTVDGKNVMYQQWFWMRTGSQTQEFSVDGSDLSLTTEIASGGHGALVYSGPGYTVTIRFSLLGGLPGSKASDLAELISIKNTGLVTLPVDFFQYANIQFSGGNDTVQFLNPYSVQQSGGGVYLDETIVNSTGLIHHQADVYPNILNSLDDNSITTLKDSNYATGDATWAFQWEQNIAPGNTFTINKDINISDPPPAIPEPQSILLLGTIVGMVCSFSRGRIRPH